MHNINVLVVDDSDVQRNHVIELCKACGIVDIDGAENGEIALNLLRTTKFDVVFVDLEMPVMNGVELVRAIAKEALAESVIILSSKDPALILSVGTMAESDGLSVLGTFKKPAMLDYIKSSLTRLAHKKPKEQLDSKGELLVAEDLLDAISKRQIKLYYQPKLTAQGQLLKGVEALARWEHPKLGTVSPTDFIEVAERFGLIQTLSEYLFSMALKQKRQWLSFGINFHLAFNLSPLSLTERRLVEKISALVASQHLSPQEIVLEVTETAIAGEVSTAIETLAKLRLKGFHVAIDDYGTGYANAQQLSRVPATELKIDRVLVDNVSTNPQQQAILKSTVNLAKELKLTIVAEGVENEMDFRFLQELDVDIIQGYFFAKPMSAEDFTHWLKNDLTKIRENLKRAD